MHAIRKSVYAPPVAEGPGILNRLKPRAVDARERGAKASIRAARARAHVEKTHALPSRKTNAREARAGPPCKDMSAREGVDELSAGWRSTIGAVQATSPERTEAAPALAAVARPSGRTLVPADFTPIGVLERVILALKRRSL